MCYFAFITISTVGYGDYSPQTVPGRLFIIVATVGGVTFFSFVANVRLHGSACRALQC